MADDEDKEELVPERAAAINEMAEALVIFSDTVKDFSEKLNKLATKDDVDEKVAESAAAQDRVSKHRRNVAVASIAGGGLIIFLIFFGLMALWVHSSLGILNKATGTETQAAQNVTLYCFENKLDVDREVDEAKLRQQLNDDFRKAVNEPIVAIPFTPPARDPICIAFDRATQDAVKRATERLNAESHKK